MMPLIQGMTWTLIVSGWRYFNRGTKFSGQTVGAKIRRWWWGQCEKYNLSPGKWLTGGRRQQLEGTRGQWHAQRQRYY